MYNRALFDTISAKLGKGKAIILLGSRQVGKTTLINQILDGRPHLFLDADDPSTRLALTEPTTAQLRAILGSNDTVFIDEAQRIPKIGITLKLITDQFKNVQLLVSGSSSFDLTNEIQEPLTGRSWPYELYPISWTEYENKVGYIQAEQDLVNRMQFGFYPDVLNSTGDEIEVLQNLVNSYLYKDILAFGNIRKPAILEKLVRALAFQIGNEVSYNELAQLVGVDKNTISNYINLLEKAFVVFRLGSYSGNLRNEIKRTQKIYFYDTGVRNMVIGNFQPLELRTDVGALWENFLMAERLKYHAYSKNDYTKMYFWRTVSQQEIDLVEEKDGTLTAFEFKWKAKKTVKTPTAFKNAYDVDIKIIDRSNFRELLD
ncbi:ATP-binding protein [Cryomorpha ignava]|uniref:ATP-binding protein n=1 Tax=Cryomorpha ignava TaxID=101383 RepID=A0A7K3WQA5_9FLAO|nr:ATP-binding protein [Cryomorpha ignava]NEN23840.1 ATP-binding protein [Cryomorpha ignava]